MYDVNAIRAQFPALSRGVAHFDSPGGSQTPRSVALAVSQTLTAGVSNRGRVTTAERRADEIVLGARQAIADLLGAVPTGVVFGRSMTQLTYDFSRALAKRWKPGDEVVVTRLDHDANIRPWVQAAERSGATIRWASFDPETAELPVSAITSQLSQRTRLVAVTGASNLLGTRPDVPAIAAEARRAGALTYVDGVHLTPHSLVDMGSLGADLLVCSPYKFCGPHLGALAASPDLLTELLPDKLLPSTDAVPERYELGTLPYELLAGTTAAVDFLAGLTSASGSRREQLTQSYAAMEEHESAMARRLEEGLKSLGVVQHSRAARRTPLLLFSAPGIASTEVYRGLAQADVNAPAGNFYAIECSRWLGLGGHGAVRAGIAPYTSVDDVDQLLNALAAIVRA